MNERHEYGGLSGSVDWEEVAGDSGGEF